MYLANDIYPYKRSMLVKGTPIEIVTKVSQQPVIFSCKANGEFYPEVMGSDITGVKPVIKTLKHK